MIPSWFPTVYAETMQLLPAKMDSPQACAMLKAIALQESRFLHRKQIGGPARGFWQFEQGGGVRGVLNHPASREHIRRILTARGYDHQPTTSYRAIETDDVLACAYARLLLYTLPGALPEKGEHDEAWKAYLEAWRPGRPHRSTWDAFYDEAWA